MQSDNMPLVSVVVPAYNSEKFIEKCIQSIIGQTYRILEIIIVNDGSNDQTRKICEDYAKNDNRIQVINKKNEGVTRARISGFNVSTGMFIMFVDADDYIHPKCVEILVNAAMTYKVDLIGCQYFNVIDCVCEKSLQRPEEGLYNKGKIISLLKESFLYNNKTKIAGMNPFLCTKLIKRKFVEEALNAGVGLWFEEDLVGTLQLLYSINSMYITSDYLYYYVQHGEQVTRRCNTDLWKNTVYCWNRIKVIDRFSYLSQQFPKRVINSVFQILWKAMSQQTVDK